MEQYHRFIEKSFSPDRKDGRRAIFCYAKIRKERRISNTIAREMQKTATFPNESKISRRKVWSVSKIRVSLHPQTATQCTPNAPMAESVDASVSNTDRETCAGSTPARSTATDWQSPRLSVCLFFTSTDEKTSFRRFGGSLKPQLQAPLSSST